MVRLCEKDEGDPTYVSLKRLAHRLGERWLWLPYRTELAFALLDGLLQAWDHREILALLLLLGSTCTHTVLPVLRQSSGS